MASDEVLYAAMVAFKQGDPDKIITTSSGLTWLRTPMERVIEAIEPMIRADERMRTPVIYERVLLDQVAADREQLGRQAILLESHINDADEREYVLLRDVLDLLRTGTVD